MYIGKFFTHVTKTLANLTTYSRKPENYNGTIIFEIDIMKNLSPINSNLCQTWLFHKCFGCLVCFCLLKVTETTADSKRKDFDSGKNVSFLSILSAIKKVWYLNQCNYCDKWANGFIWKKIETFFIRVVKDLILSRRKRGQLCTS